MKNPDLIIWSNDNFRLVTMTELPHLTRQDGGHLIIKPQVPVTDRTELTPALAVELMRLTMAAGRAFDETMNERGVDLGRINYQDNGNWGVDSPTGPKLHIHLYGRARSATIQPWGEALRFPKPETGFYDENEPLTGEDIAAIRAKLEQLLVTEEFSDSAWGL